jgi:Nickel responsive protein SCO4226-like
MPLFMDVHTIDGGVSVDDVAKAHTADLQTQGTYDVSYLRYWVDQARGKVFCLVDAPDASAAATVHRHAHGLVANEVYLVNEGTRPASRVGDRNGARRPGIGGCGAA